MTTALLGVKIDRVTTPQPLTPGQTLARKMEELGVGKMALSQASGKSRGTINKALADHSQTRQSTYADLMRVLDDIEHDRQDGPKRWVPSEDSDLVRIEMRGVFGVDSVTFSGPADETDAIQHAAVEFVRQLRENITDE